MNKQIEEQFQQEMLGLYQKAGNEIGYWANRYLRTVRQKGGLQAAKDWLRPVSHLSLPEGLNRLAKKDRLDLSMEALVLQEPWRQLFTRSELRIAEERLSFLKKYGHQI